MAENGRTVGDKQSDLLSAYESYAKHGRWERAYECARRIGRPAVERWRSEVPKTTEWWDTLKGSYKDGAREWFEDFLIFTEWERPTEQKFYLPRRKALKRVVDQLQRLADDEIDILCVSMAPGVGKTGLGVMYCVWLAGRNPLEGILTASHNKSFLEDVYSEVLRELDAEGEYLWHEAFPERQIVRQNAKNLKIDIDKAQRFSTFQFTSTDSGNAGKLRALQLLYCDDLITGIEEAVSKERLDKKWQLYTTDLRQRKYGDHCKELHIATRWSVHDIIGRIQAEYEGDPRVVSIALPVWDENEESLFPYAYSTKTLHDIQRTMDEASWKALYMNEPIEREGLLYPADELRYYFELPDREPDAVLAVCDTKDKGTDYCFQPIAYQYGSDFYIEDCVCSNALPEIVEPMLVDDLVGYKVHMARYESNSAGGRVAKDVQAEVKKRGGRCKITTKYSVTNKETRIIVNSAFIKEHMLFKSDGWDENYRNMMKMLTGYVVMGKNRNDDVPDGMAMLADFVQTIGGTVVKVVDRPF